jgi:hypothetical protein
MDLSHFATSPDSSATPALSLSPIACASSPVSPVSDPLTYIVDPIQHAVFIHLTFGPRVTLAVHALLPGVSSARG